MKIFIILTLLFSSASFARASKLNTAKDKLTKVFDNEFAALNKTLTEESFFDGESTMDLTGFEINMQASVGVEIPFFIEIDILKKLFSTHTS